MKFIRLLPCLTLALFPAAVSHAQIITIADWTFEVSQPATGGPLSPEIGSGSASGVHTGSATYSSPAGNGSAHSFSATTWAVGDSWQFQVSTLGLNTVSLSWDQASSNTGPGAYNLRYSTDGVNFTSFGSTYTVPANASPNPVWNATTSSSLYHFSFDLSSVSALNNAAAVYFRLADANTISANGGTVASGGTDRVDNFTVTASPVPEPGGLVFLASGGLICWQLIRRRQGLVISRSN